MSWIRETLTSAETQMPLGSFNASTRLQYIIIVKMKETNLGFSQLRGAGLPVRACHTVVRSANAGGMHAGGDGFDAFLLRAGTWRRAANTITTFGDHNGTSCLIGTTQRVPG